MIRRVSVRLAALLATMPLAIAPQVAQAGWVRASSPHFVIYADASPRSIERFSQELERFHSALAVATGQNQALPSPSNRVTVYVVGSAAKVRRLAGDRSGLVAGFYIPRAGGSVAFVPDLPGMSSGADFTKVVLLHEYAHHFMISSSAYAMPRWYGEGAAEFFASAKFESKGDVWIGRPANHRAGELFGAKDVSVTNLIDPATYNPPGDRGYDAFYGKSWLLFHYLTFEPGRKGQLSAYLRQIAAGKGSAEAGREVFGDLAQLERELDRYLERSQMSAFRLAAAMIQPGATTIEPLSPGLAEMMPVMVQSRRGVDTEEAKVLLEQARAVALRFPADPDVQAALAEAEYDAGNDKEALAAAEVALARDPNQVNAWVQKGNALIRQAREGGGPTLFRKAREAFLALNRIEHDHPLPLYNFYLSYRMEGRAPTANAVLALERAAQVAPFDLGLRMTLANQQITDGRRDQARSSLRPVAYNPHGGGLARLAQQMLTRLDADPNWRGEGMTGAIEAVTTDD